jgi:hypothetical protein
MNEPNFYLHSAGGMGKILKFIFENNYGSWWYEDKYTWV